MDMQMPESLFFMDLPDLRKLCTVKIYLNDTTLNSSIRDAQIKLCRHLLFLYDQIVASPNPEQFDLITIIMTISFYRTRQVQSVAEKYSTKIENPERVTAVQFQACLFYTITLRLSPHWNKTGNLLIQGADFLSKSEKQDAIDLRIIVSEVQICICVQVQNIRLPSPELSDFNVSTGTLQRFLNDPSFIIQRHFIPNNWCYVLPSMKMGQIVSIGHNISSDSPFKSYRDFQIYWNMLYGYELPSVPEDKVIYCNIYFKLIGEKLFTYPLICLRSQPIQFYPRVDMAKIVNAFIRDLKLKMPHLCGFPARISENPVYTVMELTKPQLQGTVSMINLTTKPPSGSLSQHSKYNAATCQMTVPAKQAKEEHVVKNLHHANPMPSFQMELFTSRPQPFKISCSSVKHEGTVQRYVPVFHRNNLKVNSGLYQLATQDNSMLNPLKEPNSVSLTDSTEIVLSKPTLAVKKINQFILMNNNKEIKSRAMDAEQHAFSIAVDKDQLCSAYHIQGKSKPVPNQHGAEPLLSHARNICEINCIQKITAGISQQKDENVNPTTTEYITQDTNAKEKYFDLNSKRCRTKQSIKEVDILKHAKNNELYKLNNSTLQNFLKQQGISTKARNKKEQLVAKIMQFLQEC